MRTIEQAEKECREAWAKNPSTWGWCLHHGQDVEELTEPIENRIAYILAHKAKNEIVIRLDNLRPVLSVEAVALARKTYGEAIAPAWKAYGEAIDPARKAYGEAVALARKTYGESIDPARKAYVEAITAAWNAYDETITAAWKAYGKATASARKAYVEAVASAHQNDVSNHTWNGADIFGKG